MKRGASGFRLDVADELPSEFIMELRNTVKSIDSEAAIIGEVWENASTKMSYGKRRKYLLGDELDGVMNYPAKDAMIRFIAYEKNAENLAEALEELWEDYPWQTLSCSMTILGTHDTGRILTVLGLKDSMGQLSRDEKAYLILSRDQLSEAKTGLCLLLVLWAFLPGIPCIYYGDEIGMQGAEDPFNRACFDLNKSDPEIASYYKKILDFRSLVKDISHYDFRPELIRNSLYVFSRHHENTSVFVAVNSGKHREQFSLDLVENSGIKEIFNVGEAVVSPFGAVDMAGESALVILTEF